MRISDWSSDVCSSDLPAEAAPTRASWRRAHRARRRPRPALERAPELARIAKADAGADLGDRQVAAAQQFARSLAAHLVVPDRSDEHTSEIQSLMCISYAVLCLKKKK